EAMERSRMGMLSSRTIGTAGWLRSAFWLFLAAWLGYFVFYPSFVPPRRLDLRSCGPIRHEQGPWYSTQITAFMPINFVVFEGDRSLIRCEKSRPAPEDGKGYWYIDTPPNLVWSATDGSDPRHNGRGYTMIAWDPRPAPRMEAISGVFLVVLLVAFTIQARGSAASGTVGGPQPLPVPLSLAGPSPRWLRLGFLAVTILAIGCSLRPSWDRVDICQDSASYV